jgi:hypothetical protein
MPYDWTEPELALKYKDVSVYHTYRNGFFECGRFEYHYTTDVTECAQTFDIRDLSSFRHGEAHSTILRRAIESGEITAPLD